MGYRWTHAGGWDATGIDAVLNVADFVCFASAYAASCP